MIRSFRSVVFIALTTTLLLNGVLSANQRFDPFSAFVNTLVEDIPCFVPPYQNASHEETYLPPPEGTCPTESDLSELTPEQLHELAVAYAPVLFFHPLETYTLQSVSEVFRDPALGNIQERTEGDETEFWDTTLNLTSLLLSTRDRDVGLHASRFFLQRQLWEQKPDDGSFSFPFLYGAGFNVSGYSDAVIYYNSFQWHNNTLVFNYYYFYALRGFSGMALFRHMTSSSSSSSDPTQFSLPPFGAHVSDWKTMSVMVCNSVNVSEPLAVRYDQGEQQSQITACTIGECIFYQNDTFHPVAFVALDSHAMYPVSSQMIVLEQLPADAFSNLQTVLHVDRTVYRDDESNYKASVQLFYPNSTNVLPYSPQNEIQLNTSNDDNAWQGFGGRWGDFNLSNYETANVTVFPQDPMCFNAAQTGYEICPNATENAVFQLVLELLGVRAPSSLLVRTSRILYRSVLASLPTVPPRGPATFLSYQSWLSQPENAPIWRQKQVSARSSSNDTAMEDTCTALLNSSNNTSNNDFVTPIIQVIALEDNTVSLIVFCVIVMLINMVVFVLVDFAVHYQPPPFSTNADGVPYPLGWPFYLFLLRLPIYYTVFYTGTMVAAVLFLSGYNALQGVLLKYLGFNLEGFRNAVFGCLLVLVIVDTLFLIVLWKQTHDTWYTVRSAYKEFTNGNHQFTLRSSLDEHNVTIHNTASLAYRLVHAALFSCVIFAAVVAVFGSLNIGLAYGFGQVCSKTAKVASGVCFSLNILNFKSIPCGTEFEDFCNGFAQSEIVTTFWGSFLICAGHFYLISTASALSINFRTINALANSWLSRCKELEGKFEMYEPERPEEISYDC